MTSQPDPTDLISGHATDTLSRAEQSQLYRAALEDQETFDRLVEEESWRQIFSAPGVRDELLDALAVPTPTGFRAWLDRLRTPSIPPLAMGAAAAALLAIALIPRWLELGGVAGPADPGEGPPSSVAVPSPGEAPIGEPPTGEAPISDAPISEGPISEAPGTEFVAKSYGAQRATRSLQPKSAGPDYFNVSYALELNQPTGPREVPDTWAFSPGDQFRLRLDVDFTAWLYLFNRAAGDAAYTVLYPHTNRERDPLPPSERDVLLPADVWLTMDDTPEDEQLVLVVSDKPWPLADSGRETVPARELDAALDRAEGSFKQVNWRRSEVEERVRLTVEDSEGLVVVLRLLEDRAGIREES